MQVSDIYEELKEATGSCDEGIIFRSLTRAIQLLANEGLFDPLIGTLDFTVDGGFLIALPRDVKTVLRLNINNNPSFARARLFEFQPNTNGSNDGEEVGWQWHERGSSPIQDERKLPSKLSYRVTSSDDVGKTLRVIGLDAEGIERELTLTGNTSGAALSAITYSAVKKISREETTKEAWLDAATGAIGRFQPNETEPDYRVIKIAKTGVAVRMLYRKHVFKIEALTDFIPLQSEMAVIRAVDAVRLMMRKKYDEAELAMTSAVAIIKKEQASRDEGETLSKGMEVQTATNSNISANDVLIVADIYDEAAEILGGIGRESIFDYITDAINALENKARFDSTIGYCDIIKMENNNAINIKGGKGNGFFALPRYVQSVLALNLNGFPGIPRNRWFEFHLNGSGEANRADHGTWDDFGDTPITNFLPVDETARKVIPTKVIAVANSSLDDDAVIRVFGVERLSDGREVEVYRNAVKGFLCPCKAVAPTPASDAPAFVRIDRIERDETGDFVTFRGVPETGDDIQLGYWYPDEREPRYRLIRVPTSTEKRIRIRYKKRTARVSAMNEVINLRSRLAIIDMIHAISIRSTDPQGAMAFEMMAVQRLTEEQSASNPVQASGLQFDPGTAPGHADNIQ